MTDVPLGPGPSPVPVVGRKPVEIPDPTTVEDIQDLQIDLALKVIQRTKSIKTLLEWFRLIEARGPYGSMRLAKAVWDRKERLKKPASVVVRELQETINRGVPRKENPFVEGERFWREETERLKSRFGRHVDYR